jgi:hypothetical protein
MGNSGSASETAGVKAQAEGSMKPIYSLLDLNGKLIKCKCKCNGKMSI